MWNRSFHGDQWPEWLYWKKKCAVEFLAGIKVVHIQSCMCTCKRHPFGGSDSIQLSPEGEVNSGLYVARREASIEVYIHCSSSTLRGIVVLVFTKSDGEKNAASLMATISSLKLSRKKAPFLSPFAKQWISKDTPNYGSQSKCAKIAIHWFGKY